MQKTILISAATLAATTRADNAFGEWVLLSATSELQEVHEQNKDRLFNVKKGIILSNTEDEYESDLERNLAIEDSLDNGIVSLS